MTDAGEISIPVWFDYKVSDTTFVRIYPEFQFQYGSIISQPLIPGNTFDHIFQFQYGSIIRLTALQFGRMNIHFNSSMVRL